MVPEQDEALCEAHVVDLALLLVVALRSEERLGGPGDAGRGISRVEQRLTGLVGEGGEASGSPPS